MADARSESPRPPLTALRLPPRTDSTPTSPLTASPGGSGFTFPAAYSSTTGGARAPSALNVSSASAPATVATSSTARFHEALASLPSTRHRVTESTSSEASFRLPPNSASPTGDRSFDSLQRELNQPRNEEIGLGLAQPGQANRPFTRALASRLDRPFGGQGDHGANTTARDASRPAFVTAESDATRFGDLSSFGRPASMAMGPDLDEGEGEAEAEGDTSFDFLLSPPAFDATTSSSKQMALAASDLPRSDRAVKERPLAAAAAARFNVDRNRPFAAPSPSYSIPSSSMPPTPSTILRRGSATSLSSPLTASTSLPTISQSPPRMNANAAATSGTAQHESPRSNLPYQRHRSQVSSTSSFLSGGLPPSVPRPTHQASTSVEVASTSIGSVESLDPSRAATTARIASSASTGSSEPPIGPQALLLHVLSLRSAAQPMSLSQSQGPLSRSTTPLGHSSIANHQRIRSAGSTTSDGDTDSPTTATGTSSKLDTVDLSHKRIAEVPKSVIDELKDEVEKLALGYNLLRDLSPDFAALGQKLRYLNVRVNLLTSFPQVLCEMPSLEILDISRNKIKRLPQNPGTLLGLKVFSIAKNRIKRLPVWLADMTALKVLKIDHNPLEWPPKEVTVFPLGSTQEVDGPRRNASNRMAEAEEMQRWLPNLIKWFKDEASREPTWNGASRSRDALDRRRRPSVMSLTTDDERSIGHDDGRPEPADVTPRQGLSRTASGDLPADKAPSSPTQDVGMSSALDLEDPAVRHSRNASHSLAHMLEPEPRPLLRSKKSLPDLRQSHADILAERRTGPAVEEEVSPRTTTNGFPSRLIMERPPALVHSISAKAGLPTQSTSDPTTPVTAGPPTPSSLPRSQSARPLPASAMIKGTSTSRGDETAVLSRPARELDSGKGKGIDRSAGAAFDRNSGAYFRRLSMLPVSTISKAVPTTLLSFADAIRGILFSLSQIYSSLRQFVVFASQDRLPAPIARLMGVADGSMSELINALDRFDSLSRRGTPSSAIIRNIFVTCKDSVSTFVKLVAALHPQLKSLLATADARYTRTLLLMLYGSMGEISNSWSAVSPFIEEMAAIVEDPSPATAALQAPLAASSASSSSTSTSTAKRGGVSKGLSRVRSKTRRHAGSFSVEDVQLGAELPPAPMPQVPAAFASSVEPSTASSAEAVSGGSTLKARSAKSKGPGAITLPPALGYSDMIMKAFEQPMTPGVVRDLVRRDPAPVPSLPTTGAPEAALNGTTGMLTPASSFSTVNTARPGGGSGAGRPVSVANADAAFVDMAESTITIARSIYGMLLDSFDADFEGDDEAGALMRELGPRRIKELTDLCILGNETTTKLKGALGRVRAPDSRGPLKFSSSDAKRLGDEAYAFVQTVIRFAKLVKAISLEHGFAPRIREGVGQLTIATRELAKALHTATSFRPSVSSSSSAAVAGTSAVPLLPSSRP